MQQHSALLVTGPFLAPPHPPSLSLTLPRVTPAPIPPCAVACSGMLQKPHLQLPKSHCRSMGRHATAAVACLQGLPSQLTLVLDLIASVYTLVQGHNYLYQASSPQPASNTILKETLLGPTFHAVTTDVGFVGNMTAVPLAICLKPNVGCEAF